MPTISSPNVSKHAKPKEDVLCYHCSAPCLSADIAVDDKVFCCDGCKLVYEILNQNGLCDYYKIQSHPGLSQIKPKSSNKFEYLDNKDIAAKLYTFTDGKTSVITWYIPSVHCSSCMWLLEHLNRLDEGVASCRLNFSAKEVTIRFDETKTSLRRIAELMATIGYEPYISLNDADKKKTLPGTRQKMYKLGVAGFCFGNIMLMSIPEYLSGPGMEHEYASLFRVLNLLLALPVFFYSASEFFMAAWAGIKQRMLNIDAPIALSVTITFSRSVYEVLSGTGGGYFDSMAGIVFFMLVGRLVQERAYRSISFHRDYKSYFPVAVTKIIGGGKVSTNLQDLKEQDVILLHHGEIIPADAIIVKGIGNIDYSFVTGESEPVTNKPGDLVYAGGKQTGSSLQVQLIKPVAGSYLTSLWNHNSFSKSKRTENEKASIIHTLSKYFTVILFTLVLATAVYWWMNDASKLLPAITAMLIVACPCALLLSANYTNGNILRLLSDYGLFLRDSSVIEQLGNVNHIVFDKTGTLTKGSSRFAVSGHNLTDYEEIMLYNVAVSGTHPYSKALVAYLGARPQVDVKNREEIAGMGVYAEVDENIVRIGSAAHVGLDNEAADKAAGVYVRINDNITAFYITPEFRKSTPGILTKLAKRYKLSLLSGDNERQKRALKKYFEESSLFFEQSPSDKLRYIERLQYNGDKTLMIGDGLNDAGALQQSDVGISLSDDVNGFSPACDAILDAKRMSNLPALLRLATSGKYIIRASFGVSILYNIIGLYFSVQGRMNPMIAAILMPMSTLSIVLVSTGISALLAKYYGLSSKTDNYHISV